MLAFTLRRALQAIGVMIAVGIIAFSMFRFAGDPVNQIVSLDTPAAEREAVRKRQARVSEGGHGIDHSQTHRHVVSGRRMAGGRFDQKT